MRKTITSCLTVAMLLASGTAWADFAEKKTLSISGDRLFGIYLTQINADDEVIPGGSIDIDATEIGLLWQEGGITPYTAPRLSIDFFVIDHLSIGGSLAYYNLDGEQNNFGVEAERNAFFFGPRIGGAWMFNDWAGIWPRGGIQYYSVGDGDGDHTWQLVFNADVAFVLSPWENFAFTVGPAFDIGMLGQHVDDADGPGQPEEKYDIHVHSFGLISAGILGYFNL